MVKEIPLTQGKVAIVDDEDYEQITKFSWHFKKGYAFSSIKTDGSYKFTSMHRLLTNVKDGEFVDHINRDKLDNRKSNLRICTKSQNSWNKVKRKDGKSSKHKCVFFSKQKSMFESELMVNGKRIYLGAYENEDDAAYYYNIAVKEHHGEYAVLNDLPEEYVPTVPRWVRKRRAPTSKYRGVSYVKALNSYRVAIYHNGKDFLIGHFSTERVAAEMYNVYAIELKGSKAKLNTFDQMEGLIDG